MYQILLCSDFALICSSNFNNNNDIIKYHTLDCNTVIRDLIDSTS